MNLWLLFTLIDFGNQGRLICRPTVEVSVPANVSCEPLVPLFCLHVGFVTWEVGRSLYSHLRVSCSGFPFSDFVFSVKPHLMFRRL